MITATKIFTFDAAHYLEGHLGLCQQLHGHTYKLEVTISKNPKEPISDSNPIDMVLDFSDLKKIVAKSIIEVYDHTCINDNPQWPNIRPTAENMVHEFAIILIGKGLNLMSLKLWETPTSCVTWTKE